MDNNFSYEDAVKEVKTEYHYYYYLISSILLLLSSFVFGFFAYYSYVKGYDMLFLTFNFVFACFTFFFSLNQFSDFFHYFYIKPEKKVVYLFSCDKNGKCSFYSKNNKTIKYYKRMKLEEHNYYYVYMNSRFIYYVVDKCTNPDEQFELKNKFLADDKELASYSVNIKCPHCGKIILMNASENIPEFIDCSNCGGKISTVEGVDAPTEIDLGVEVNAKRIARSVYYLCDIFGFVAYLIIGLYISSRIINTGLSYGCSFSYILIFPFLVLIFTFAFKLHYGILNEIKIINEK